MARIIEVLEYDPSWKMRFEEEKTSILQMLNEVAIRVHHIGSTSVPGMSAKPIIDILLEVTDLQSLDDRAVKLECLQYEPRGENGIANRRFFQKGGDSRTHHIHAFVTGSEQVTRHLYFRDYLIAHPFDVIAYSNRKKKLAATYRNRPEAYANEKSDYVQSLEQRARLWYLSLPTDSPLDAAMRACRSD